MSTITLQHDGIEEFYTDGVLTEVIVRYSLAHPTHGDYHGAIEVANLNAWANASDNAKTGLIRAAVAQDGNTLDARLDATPVYTGNVLDDALFGAPIEL